MHCGFNPHIYKPFNVNPMEIYKDLSSLFWAFWVSDTNKRKGSLQQQYWGK